MDWSRQEIARQRDPGTAWERDGEPVAAVASDLLHATEALGVLVAATPTLDNVTDLFRARSHVTLVAHWKGAALTRDDILVEPSTLIERLQSTSGAVAEVISRRLHRADLAAALGKQNSPARRGAAAELLNLLIIDDDNPLPGVLGSEREMVYRPWLRAQHRRLLDEMCPDLLVPGNRIELRDGLHTPSAIVQRIDPQWAGVIDLALCHSAVAATTFKAGNCARRIAFNHEKILPQVRLPVLRVLYHRLAGGGRNYATELRLLMRSLSDLSEAHG